MSVIDDCKYGPLLEVRKPVVGFENYYEISNYGKVFSLRTGGKGNYRTDIKPTLNTNGYLMFGVRIGDFRKTILVHRMVAMCFIPNPDNKSFSNHNNCIKSDPFVLNICWMTASENTKHAWENGMMKCTSHHRRCLTSTDIIKIRELVKTEMTIKSIADIFNVAPFAISKIRDNKTYKNIK